MQIEDAVIDALKALPSGEKLKVLEFTRGLVDDAERAENGTKRKSMIGCLSHLNVKFSKDDLKQARREMWPDYGEDYDV